MTEPLHILMLEDNPIDVDLIQFELQEGGIEFIAKVVITEKDYNRELQEHCPDLILSDYDIPNYNGAIALAEAKRRCPDTPFILVTGAVSEDRAIEILTQGAKDYVLKTRLQQRLVPAIRRALAETEEHRARKQAEVELREAYRTMEEKVKIRTMELEAEMAARQKTEDALRESDKRLKFALETSLIGAWDLDLEDHSAFRSLNHDLIFGYKDLLPLWTYEMFLEHVLPEDRMMVDRQFQNAIATHSDWKFECRIRRADGEVRWIFAAGRHWSNSSGNVKRLAGIVQDITERKQAEAEQQLAYNRIQTIFDHRINGIGITIVAADGHIKQANDYYLGILGCTRDELISGKIKWKDFTPPEWLAADEEALARLQEIGYAGPGEKEYVRRDGSSVPVLVTAAMLPGDEREVLAFVLDITKWKQAEKALRDRERLLQDVIDDSTSPIFLKDIDGKFITINASLEGLLGISREDIKGKTDYDIAPKEVADYWRTHDKEVMKTGKAIQIEEAADLQDGHHIFLANKFPLINAKGRMYGIGAISHDITGRKQAEQVLEEQTRQLENANRELESFSYSVSHDLKAPLRAIEGYSRMLLKKDTDKLSVDTMRKLDIIHSNTKKMNVLIDDLLSFSRVLNSSIAISEINMEKLAKDVWAEIKAANTERKLEFKIKSVLPGKGDPTLIRQVLVNLLSNAVKFTKARKPGIIEINSYPERGKIVYCIKDNGVGFDMEYYSKLFGVFQRLHSNEEYEGTGIGLAIIHRIISRHGERIWAEGKVDKGATFFFTLPT